MEAMQADIAAGKTAAPLKKGRRPRGGIATGGGGAGARLEVGGSAAGPREPRARRTHSLQVGVEELLQLRLGQRADLGGGQLTVLE